MRMFQLVSGLFHLLLLVLCLIVLGVGPDLTEGSAVIDGRDELSPALPPLFFDDPAGHRSFNLKGGEVFCSWLPVEFTFCLFPVLYSLFAVCI